MKKEQEADKEICNILNKKITYTEEEVYNLFRLYNTEKYGHLWYEKDLKQWFNNNKKK